MSALDYFSLGHPLTKLRTYFSGRARGHMFSTFMRMVNPAPDDKILDLGVTPDTTLPESNYFERLYPHRTRIVAASIEEASNLEIEFPGVRFRRIVPGPLPFSDNEFDVLFCSAVLEHVGSREAQRCFIAETLRVSRKVFITTPNRWFPIEFHTLLPLLHWLPQPIHQWLLRRLGFEFLSKTANLNLLGPSELIALLPSNTQYSLSRQRLFGATSNLILYSNKCGLRKSQ